MENPYESLVAELMTKGIITSGKEPGPDEIISLLPSLPATKENADLLQRLAETAPKKLAKEARRTLYLWYSRGIAAPPAQSRTWRLATGHRALDAYLTHIDGQGGRVILYCFSQPGTAYGAMFSICVDTRGIERSEVQVLKKAGYQSLIDSIKKNEDLTYVSADPAYCRALLKHFYHLNRERRGPVPRDFELFRSYLGPDEPLPQPLIYNSLSADEVHQARTFLVSNSTNLLNEREMSTWFFDGPIVEKALEQLNSRQQSSLVLSPGAQQALTEGVKEQMLKDIFTPAFQRVYARRLEEMAYVFWNTGREMRAREAVAVALSMKDSGGVAFIPFLRSLVEKTIAINNARKQGAQAPGGSESGLYIPGRQTNPSPFNLRRP